MANWVLRVVGVLLMATALGLALSRAPDRPVESLVARGKKGLAAALGPQRGALGFGGEDE